MIRRIITVDPGESITEGRKIGNLAVTGVPTSARVRVVSGPIRSGIRGGDLAAEVFRMTLYRYCTSFPPSHAITSPPRSDRRHSIRCDEVDV
jgi:hypothetical protein